MLIGHENSIACSLIGKCSGCAWLDLPYKVQLENKIDSLKRLWSVSGAKVLPKINMISIAPGGLRDRVDLTLQFPKKLGLYDFKKVEIIDILECPQLSPQLES